MKSNLQTGQFGVWSKKEQIYPKNHHFGNGSHALPLKVEVKCLEVFALSSMWHRGLDEKWRTKESSFLYRLQRRLDISGDQFFAVSIKIYKTDSERDSDKFSDNMYLISDMQASLVVVIFFV